MQQALLAWHEFDECAEWHDRLNYTFIGFTYLRYSNYAFYPAHGCIYLFFIRSKYFYYTAYILHFFNINSSTGFALYFLYGLTARAYHSTDKLTVDDDLLDARCMGLQFRTVFRQAIIHCIQYVHTAVLCLGKCLCKYFLAKAVYFNIHLDTADTIACTGYFKVHITQVIFIAQDISKYNYFAIFARDKTHPYTTYWLSHWYT